MEETLRMYKATEIPPGNKPIDPRADPKYYDYTWTNWMDIIDPKAATEVLEEEQGVNIRTTKDISNVANDVEIVLV